MKSATARLGDWVLKNHDGMQEIRYKDWIISRLAIVSKGNFQYSGLANLWIEISKRGLYYARG